MVPSNAQPWNFRFTTDKKVQMEGATQVQPSDRYSAGTAYGFDFIPSPAQLEQPSPFFFSLRVPDGNYRVTVLLGSRHRAAVTTVRAESRRLFVENLSTKKGELKEVSFIVHKHSPQIDEQRSMRLKPRELQKLNFDDRLTIEVNGDAPALATLRIEPAPEVPTVFLCGNSTVVDQDNEPWASWGQMITRWFGPEVAFANFAESGETASTFISANRLAKALSMMKAGDYLIAEFGHNDQKQRFPGAGAYYNFATALKTFIDETRARGATPIFVTPTQRRSFKDGHIQETHANYPEAMAWVAKNENVPLIDLHQMTRTFYEAMGEEQSKRAFVHYPAGSYPGQTQDFKDNTHFNPYGAYEIAKCIIEGMKQLQLPFLSALRPEYQAFDPEHPDEIDSFHWNDSPFFEADKPDGN
ncbi:MAG: rhamnogalacturonan acetylesterase [Bacteroidaceae bacterium]|nr:rhamnogalacturonan acetylesterase [Bacteroidaceae bacterium]